MTRAARLFLAILVSLLASTAAHAQLFRTYVASDGSDANPCTLPQPCRLLPAAIAAVASGGEIWILDSANYNTATVNVTKSVSIVAVPGQIASLVAIAGAPAVSIATAGVVVSFRNVVFTKIVTNPGTYGLSITNATRVTIDDCLFANLDAPGIMAQGTTAAINVSGSLFRDIAAYAITVQNGPIMMLANSRLHGNGAGVRVISGAVSSFTVVNVTDSSISGGTFGVSVSSDVASVSAFAVITRSTIFGMSNGVSAVTTAGNAFITLSNNTIALNGQGFVQSGAGAQVKAYGNNYLNDNIGGESGTLTTAPLR